MKTSNAHIYEMNTVNYGNDSPGPVLRGAISNYWPQIGILFLSGGLYESHPVGGLQGAIVYQ